MFQLFGDMEQSDILFEGGTDGVGVFMSDSGLFQRTFPDGIVDGEELGDRFRAAMHKNSGNPVDEEAAARLMKEIGEKDSLMYDFIQSAAFPNFFGVAMPLVKYGLPIHPVQLDNVRRFAGYLEDYKCLVLSYEYMKPDAPDVNAAVVSWIREGGTLIYVGDGSDPFHKIDAWWGQRGYANPAEHLVQKTLADTGITWTYRNDLTLHRGPYVISSVMAESVSDEKKVFTGVYADLMTNDYAIIHEKDVAPDDVTLLFDFSKIEGEDFRIVGTSARVEEGETTENGVMLRLKTADKIKAFTRVRLPKQPTDIKAIDEDGEAVAVESSWDEETKTLLVSYQSVSKEVCVTGKWA